MEVLISPMIVLVLLAVLVAMGFHVLREYERAVIFRFGRVARGLVGGNGPGIPLCQDRCRAGFSKSGGEK